MARLDANGVRWHPLIFTGEMVRAILRGEKSQTRRLLSPQPEPSGDPDFPWMVIRKNCRHMRPDGSGLVEAYDKYRVGDRIWVRETFCELKGPGGKPRLWYRADGASLPAPHKWKPPIHMPREVCRLELELTGVSIERLQAISSSDAWEEGARCSCMSPVPICAGNIVALEKLWDEINGDRASWGSNPWVFALKFVVTKGAKHGKGRNQKSVGAPLTRASSCRA